VQGGVRLDLALDHGLRDLDREVEQLTFHHAECSRARNRELDRCVRERSDPLVHTFVAIVGRRRL
jgi:hypothetical protein